MNRRLYLALATLLAITWCAAMPSASAAVISFQANLDGLQEVPPNASPAYGFAEATLDDTSGLFTITTGTYADLLGGATAVTLQDGGVGVSGPVILSLVLDTPGATTGTFSGSGTITNLTQLADVLAGNGYLNLRSSVFPSGELRGQLLPVPEPATWVLLILGGIGALWAGRRHRRLTP